MPTDSNGVHSLPAGYLAITGTTVLASQHNPPLEDLSASVTLRLMASGVTPMTGPLKGYAGSASAPAFTFAAGTTTGIYKTADGIGFSIGGAQVAELVAGGFRTGARYIGELIPFTGLTAPALTVLPFGQTLSRTTYSVLWDFAQVEIAAGNTLYNNGNGTTTFGVPDYRGRMTAYKDNMGGSAAGRLTSTTVSPDGNTLGGTAGAQTVTLAQANLPNVVPTFTGIQGTATSTNSNIPVNATAPTNLQGYSSGVATIPIVASIIANLSSTFTPTGTISSINGNVTPTAVNNVPPIIITNCVIFAGA